LAVGEIVPLMSRAKEAQIDMKFELISDYEILRLQFYLFIHGHIPSLANRPEIYGFRNMIKIRPLKILSNKIIHFFTHTTYVDKDIFETAIETDEDKFEKQRKMLVEIKNELKNPKKNHQKVQQPSSQVAVKSKHVKN